MVMKNNAKLLYVVYTMKLKKSRKFYHLLKILRTKHRAFREECTADTRVLAQIRAVLYNYKMFSDRAIPHAGQELIQWIKQR